MSVWREAHALLLGTAALLAAGPALALVHIESEGSQANAPARSPDPSPRLSDGAPATTPTPQERLGMAVTLLNLENTARDAAIRYDLRSASLAYLMAVSQCDYLVRTTGGPAAYCAGLRLLHGETSLLAGYPSDAETATRSALDFYRTDPTSRSALQAHRLLAEVLSDQSRHVEAEAQARRALHQVIAVIGDRAASTGATYQTLGGVLWRAGNINQAEPHIRRALTLFEGQPQWAENSASANSVLGSILAEQGRLDLAEAAHRRALAFALGRIAATNRRRPGPATGLIFQGLGDVLERQGRFAEAEPNYRRALAINHDLFGNTHQRTAESHRRLGSALEAQGRGAEAELHYRHAVTINEGRRPDLAQLTGQRLRLATYWLNARAHRRESYALFDQALQAVVARIAVDAGIGEFGRTALAGNSGSFVGQVQAAWSAAHVLPAPDRLARLATDYQEDRGRFRRLPVDCPVSGPRGGLGICFGLLVGGSELATSAGQPLDGEAYARHALALVHDINDADRGDDWLFGTHPYPRLIAHAAIAATLEVQGRRPEAERLRRLVLDHRVNIHRAANAETVAALIGLGLNLHGQGRSAEAEPHLRRAFALRLEMLGDRHAGTAAARNHVAGVLAALGKAAEAEAMLRRALGIYLALYGETHPDTAATYEALGAALRQQGRAAEADAMSRRAEAIRAHLAAATAEEEDEASAAREGRQ